MKKKFFITTPIYYVNSTPHIGHAATTTVADIIARYYRQKGNDVFFLTGTDEHGLKIAQAAQKAKKDPQTFCDQVSEKFKVAWKKLNISYDFFIRTTDPRHEKVVKEFLERIYQRGDIYKGKYEGLYCIECEKFLTEKELVNGHCPYHPKSKVIHQSEENYFFRLSKYAPQLISLIENPQTNYIFPEGKRKEILAKLKEGIEDVSISREKVKWGIPLPWDKKHTVYVWVDALINYYSATRFVKGKKDFWPANLHLIGKEILWFHTVIWQAMLLSAGLPLPQKIFAHSFYTIDGEKMSKSLGNVIYPEEMVEKFGADGARYLIATSFPYRDDADTGWERMKEKYNADLANNLGNLVSRVAKIGERLSLTNPRGERRFWPEMEAKVENLNLPAALDWLWQTKITVCNLVLNQQKPWEKSKAEARKIIAEIIVQIQNISFNLAPFLPETSKKIDHIFAPGKKLTAPQKVLFPRLK